MELAAHWHRCQILQKTSENFHQHSTQREASLSSEAVSPKMGFQLARQFSRCSKIPVIVRSLVFRLLKNPCRLPTTKSFPPQGTSGYFILYLTLFPFQIPDLFSLSHIPPNCFCVKTGTYSCIKHYSCSSQKHANKGIFSDVKII